MSIVNKNIKIVRGDTYAFNLSFTKDGEVVNITDYKIMFTLKKKSNNSDDDALISKTVTVEDGTAGVAKLELSHTDTDINAGIYVYDIQIVTDTNSVHTPLLGTITIISDITQAVV